MDEPAVRFELALEGECNAGCGGEAADVVCVRWDREAKELVFGEDPALFRGETEWEDEVTVTIVSPAEITFEEGDQSAVVTCSIGSEELDCTGT